MLVKGWKVLSGGFVGVDVANVVCDVVTDRPVVVDDSIAASITVDDSGRVTEVRQAVLEKGAVTETDERGAGTDAVIVCWIWWGWMSAASPFRKVFTWGVPKWMKDSGIFCLRSTLEMVGCRIETDHPLPEKQAVG